MKYAIVALFPLLLTEYGLLPRRTALERLSGDWRPSRSLTRAVFWILIWISSDRSVIAAILFGATFLLGEATVLVLRRTMRIDLQEGRTQVRPIAHFLPVIAALLSPAILLGLRELGSAAPAIPPVEPFAWASAVLGIMCWATLVTVSVVNLARPDQVQDSGSRGMGPGEVIGILERLVAFVLVVSGALPAIGFVIAAKAAARFPLFKEKAFAEYFLIGTLTSVGLALLFGLLVKAL